MGVIVVAGGCVAAAAVVVVAAAVVVERIKPNDNQTYRRYLVIVAAEAAAAEAIVFVRAGLCRHQCRNPKIQFKKIKKEETQNEENKKKEKNGGDKMQIGDDRKNRTTDRNPLANNRNLWVWSLHCVVFQEKDILQHT